MSWIRGAVRPLAALAAFGALALPAAAQTIYDPLTTRDVTRLLESQGYEAEVEAADEENEGDYITSKFDKISFWIHFTACDEDGTNCEAIVFDAGFTYNDEDDRPTLEEINEWNEYNLGKAGLDKQGDPYINIEINIVGGVTRDNMIDNITWWKNMLGEFTDYIGWD
jgi:hypothetical protein